MRTKLKFNFTININDKKNNLIIKSILKEKEILCILLKLISANIKYKNLIYHRHQTVPLKDFNFMIMYLYNFSCLLLHKNSPVNAVVKRKRRNGKVTITYIFFL